MVILAPFNQIAFANVASILAGLGFVLVLLLSALVVLVGMKRP